MARHGLFKGEPRWSNPPGKKHVLFTDQIEDNVKIFCIGDERRKKQWNFTDQIEDNQPTI